MQFFIHDMLKEETKPIDPSKILYRFSTRLCGGGYTKDDVFELNGNKIKINQGRLEVLWI